MTKKETGVFVVVFVCFKNRVKWDVMVQNLSTCEKRQESYHHQFRVSLLYTVTSSPARATVARHYLKILNK